MAAENHVGYVTVGLLTKFHDHLLDILKGLRTKFVAVDDFEAIKARLEALEQRPQPKYLGTYEDGRMYSLGECVTHKGCCWYCKSPTYDRPDFSESSAKSWVLMVKKARTPRICGDDGR
jgi:hypothetical protein